MPHLRLFNIEEECLEVFDLDHHPPYLAASHTWSENVFPADRDFSKCFAGKGMKAVVHQRYPDIKYCWFDTVCIDQRNENDKLEQIPLMDRIFGEAECVVVFISSHIGATQMDVDWLTGKLEGALAMCQAEAWKEEGSYWQSAEGRKWLLLGKQCLLRLASTKWATRIWTLQEYVLAKSVLWIGLDLQPIKVDDFVISALPDICNTLTIEECLTPEFKVLDAHFAGMANARLRSIDRTRIMELPGNRKATVPVDEVYGCMAASGVTLEPVSGESKTEAWERWCEEAVRRGNIRWILLPASLSLLVESERTNCVFPQFSNRHEVSGCSGLDAVKPLSPTTVTDGSVIATARFVGFARFIRRLGHIHEPEPGSIYRDITLILFAEGNWSLALKLVWAFGGGRYNTRQARVLAQVLVQSYARAVRTIASHREHTFQPVLSSSFQQVVWNDFLALQQSRMLGLNVGEAYLCSLALLGLTRLRCLTVVVVRQPPPNAMTTLLDFEAEASDGRPLLMVVQDARLQDGTHTFHKLGMTMGISEDVAKLWAGLSLRQVRIGGLGCSGCQDMPSNGIDDLNQKSQEPRKYRHSSKMRQLERQQERMRFELFTQRSFKKMGYKPRTPSLKMGLQAKRLRRGLEGNHARFFRLVKDAQR